MAINNIINDQWQGHSHGEVEDALKALLAQMLQDIEAAGIPAGGVTADMLAQSLLTLINGKYSKPGTGVPANDLEGNIPASKLASAVQSSLGKADTALQSESDPVFAASAAHGITSTDINNWNNKANSAAIPTKTSDLTNDSGFVTDEDIEDFVTAESIEEIVTGSADVMVVETPGYIDIVFAESSITVKVGNDEVSGISLHTDGTAHESEQLSISGNHLKTNIGAALSGADASDYELSTDGTTYGSTATIAVTNEAVSNASLYVRYKGAKTAGTVSDATLTLTAGTVSKTISLHYSYASGPTILADNTLTIKAAAGQSNTGQLAVTGLNLTAGINATVSGTGFTVSSSENGTYGSQASLPSSGGTLYVKFSPTGSTGSTGTLTLSSTGATSKTVDLTGVVSTLTVSVQSLSLSTEAGTPVYGTFTVQGANLTQDISISASGTGFSVSPATIDKDGAATAQTVTVTYNPSAAGTNTGTVSIQSSGLSETITLSGTAAEVPNFNNENNHRLIIGGIAYGVIDDGNGGWTDKLAVYNKQYSSAEPASAYKYTGEIIIPSTINAQLDGVPTTFTVTTIKTHAFDRSTGMTKLVIPNSVISAENAFLYMPSGNLKHLVIGNGLTNVDGGANMPTNSNGPIVRTSLNYLDLGTGIKRFAGFEIRMAVGSTVVLRSDSVVGASPAALNSNSNNNYAPAIVDGIVKVPSSLVPSYQGASGWGVPTGNGYYMVEYNNILAIE